jgi:hypothetical protein
VDHDLDQHEDDCSKASGNSGCHSKTSENGSQALATIPTPLDLGRSDCSHTNTSNGRNQSICRGNMCGMACTPHNPGGSGG